jgi:hypothetical protein
MGVTCTDGLSLEIDSAAPAAGAGPVSITVATDGAPPVTMAGLRLRKPGASGVPGGTTLTIALWLDPLYVAVTVIGVIELMVAIGTEKVALVARYCTVTA